jgi:hypothetical protein
MQHSRQVSLQYCSGATWGLSGGQTHWPFWQSLPPVQSGVQDPLSGTQLPPTQDSPAPQVSQGLPQPSSAQAAWPAQFGAQIPFPHTPGVPPPPQVCVPLQAPHVPEQPSLPQFLPPPQLGTQGNFFFFFPFFLCLCFFSSPT